ncbi:MAG: hypothetical protein VXZ39_06085, partial [Planctomycetota bacterium]|nr:hypothetical protein [Planctomycetota bacterium]
DAPGADAQIEPEEEEEGRVAERVCWEAPAQMDVAQPGVPDTAPAGIKTQDEEDEQMEEDAPDADAEALGDCMGISGDARRCLLGDTGPSAATLECEVPAGDKTEPSAEEMVPEVDERVEMRSDEEPFEEKVHTAEPLSMQTTEALGETASQPASAGGAGAGIGEGDDSILEAAASVEPARTDPPQAAGGGRRRRRGRRNKKKPATAAPTEVEVQSAAITAEAPDRHVLVSTPAASVASPQTDGGEINCGIGGTDSGEESPDTVLRRSTTTSIELYHQAQSGMVEVQSGEYATREDTLTDEQEFELGRISRLLSTGCTAYDILNVAQHTSFPYISIRF